MSTCVAVEPWRRRHCHNADGSPKRRYGSRKLADKFARRTNQDHRNDPPTSAYLCPAGRDHWHVGASSWGDPS